MMGHKIASEMNRCPAHANIGAWGHTQNKPKEGAVMGWREEGGKQMGNTHTCGSDKADKAKPSHMIYYIETQLKVNKLY